ncbi:uncharacterized protein LOC127700553 isoform X2 [Mytilus californianus]|uniref:uncharacterized protein LOC127700553 isoform X2 n=1 Tax=Mytilus californianus TaxID=6549 RepID=UPI0022483AFA|nr:uncharacterized protein LOC127700553 isoform X2 [Mytilus californianus]
MTSLVYLVIGFTSCIFKVIESTQQPEITVTTEVTVGFNVDLTCSYPVEENKTRTFKWYVNDTQHSIVQQRILRFIVKKTDKYNVYKCEVEVTTTGSQGKPRYHKTIKLQPKYPPTIHMKPLYICDRLLNINLSCEAEGYPAKYTFSNWEHRVDGTVIRHLPGVNIDNISYLKLSRCTYQDTGTYYCTVGNNVSHPNNTQTSVGSVDFKVNDYPVVIGHSIVNATDSFDIMISYYSYPTVIHQKLYRDSIELVPPKFSQNLDIPFLIHRKIVPIEGTVLVIKVSNTGDYRYVIQNNYGSVNGTVDVWSRKTQNVPSGTTTEELPLCSFMSLGFQLQVVIIVVAGIVVCVVVLAVAMIVIRRCGSSETSRDKTKETQKERRLTRVRSVLEDGTVVYDEVDDSKWVQEKKERKAKKKKVVNCNVPEAYEDVGVKNPGQSYEMLHKHNSKSKPFFRKKSSKVAKRMEILTTSGPSGTQENLYSTNSSNSDHYDNTAIKPDVKTSLSKNKISLPKRENKGDSIVVYDDAISNDKLVISCKATVHEPCEYITMKPKDKEDRSMMNKEDRSMKDKEDRSMKDKEYTSMKSNVTQGKDDGDIEEALYVNLKLR